VLTVVIGWKTLIALHHTYTVKKLVRLDSMFEGLGLCLFFVFCFQQNIALSSRPKLKFHSHALDI